MSPNVQKWIDVGLGNRYRPRESLVRRETVRRHDRIYLETGTRLTFRKRRRSGRVPLLLAVLGLSTLGLGFAAYLDPMPGNGIRAIAVTDGYVADDTDSLPAYRALAMVESVGEDNLLVPSLGLEPLPEVGQTEVGQTKEVVYHNHPLESLISSDVEASDSGPTQFVISSDGEAFGIDPNANGTFPDADLNLNQHSDLDLVTYSAAHLPGTADQPEAASIVRTLVHSQLNLDSDRSAHWDWQEYTVEAGDNLSKIFSLLGIHSQLRPVLAIGGSVRELERIYPGERLHAATYAGDLQLLVYEPRGDHYLKIIRNEDDAGFEARRKELPLETELRVVHAEIQQSLFLDGSRAGLSDGTLMQIAEIFGWDIDFAWDIRQGDRLLAVYERVYRDGQYLRDGPVLAAEFENRGRRLQAFRFAPDGDKFDYYTAEGNSLRQAFIRTPVDVGRISSSFGPRRHPILGYTRLHQGVDYAAPTGTPIRAAGNGRIVHRGTRGGYGNTVIIDHGNGRQTLYAHMNNFRSGQSVGSRVRQGEVIGYVGMTGLATGPHLHYEFHIDGKPVNPVTVELPRSEPLPRQHMDRFRQTVTPMLVALNEVRDLQIAEARPGSEQR